MLKFHTHDHHAKHPFSAHDDYLSGIFAGFNLELFNWTADGNVVRNRASAR